MRSGMGAEGVKFDLNYTLANQQMRKIMKTYRWCNQNSNRKLQYTKIWLAGFWGRNV